MSTHNASFYRTILTQLLTPVVGDQSNVVNDLSNFLYEYPLEKTKVHQTAARAYGALSLKEFQSAFTITGCKIFTDHVKFNSTVILSDCSPAASQSFVNEKVDSLERQICKIFSRLNDYMTYDWLVDSDDCEEKFVDSDSKILYIDLEKQRSCYEVSVGVPYKLYLNGTIEKGKMYTFDIVNSNAATHINDAPDSLRYKYSHSDHIDFDPSYYTVSYKRVIHRVRVIGNDTSDHVAPTVYIVNDVIEEPVS